MFHMKLAFLVTENSQVTITMEQKQSFCNMVTKIFKTIDNNNNNKIQYNNIKENIKYVFNMYNNFPLDSPKNLLLLQLRKYYNSAKWFFTTSLKIQVQVSEYKMQDWSVHADLHVWISWKNKQTKTERGKIVPPKTGEKWRFYIGDRALDLEWPGRLKNYFCVIHLFSKSWKCSTYTWVY